jgi:hypothetical protein
VERTLADKLGVKPGQRVRLEGAVDAELAGAGTIAPAGEADVIFLGVQEAEDLEHVPLLVGEMARDGAIWVIRPKGLAGLTEAMVIGAGRRAGLYDVKIARVSDELTAMKFVIPLADR